MLDFMSSTHTRSTTWVFSLIRKISSIVWDPRKQKPMLKNDTNVSYLWDESFYIFVATLRKIEEGSYFYRSSVVVYLVRKRVVLQCVVSATRKTCFNGQILVWCFVQLKILRGSSSILFTNQFHHHLDLVIQKLLSMVAID